MSKFLPLSAFDRRGEKPYKILPFRFTRLTDSRYVVSNMVGEFLVIDRSTIEEFINNDLKPGSDIYNDLAARHFLIDPDSSVGVDLLALKTRTRLERLSEFTGLHIFVVTLRCEHSCPYCQVSRQNIDTETTFDMSPDTAEKAIEFAFRSPAKNLKFEFQGGEPFLNFSLIKYIVLRSQALNETIYRRNLRFVIATNLALLDDEILAFCKEYHIDLSTSLDGPRELHNRNRPRPGGDSYQRAINGIERVRAILGHDRVSAVMTTTKASLAQPKEIIDEYVERGFDSIFLRPLSPYGFALKTKSYSAYDTNEWLQFYKTGLEYIISLNKKGKFFIEAYAAIILSKMLTPFSSGYVDLSSPAGIGIGALVYNYEGSVYASDEARMLAEMDDQTFRLGNLHRDSYKDIILSEKLLEPLEASMTLSAPICTDCAFEPYCGSDPVFHYATQGDFIGRKATSSYCQRNLEIFRYLIQRLEEDRDIHQIFCSWAAAV